MDDPDTWTVPHLLHLKREYVSLVDNYGCVVETFTVQEPPASPSEMLLLPPLKCLYKANERTQERPQSGDSRPVTYAIETDHEKVGTLDNEHWKI